MRHSGEFWGKSWVLVQAIVYAVCISLFSIQTYNLVQNLVAPTMTHTYAKEVPLKEIDFPLEMKICVSPSLNVTALKGFGYYNVYNYTMGLHSNHSRIGWGGGSSGDQVSAAEILEATRLDIAKKFVKRLGISSQGGSWKFLNLSEDANLTRINPVHDCHILNLKDMENRQMSQLYMYFHNLPENSSVVVKLLGRELTSHRDIQEHQFYSFGEPMKLNIVGKKFTSYIARIKSNVFVEEDPSQTCRDYPTSEFSSYMDCDDHFMRRKIDEVAPGLNLTPVWFTDDFDMVTTEPLQSNINQTASKGNNKTYVIISNLYAQRESLFNCMLFELSVLYGAF